MTVQDERLKQLAIKAIALQEQGLFIVDQRRELPIPGMDKLDVRYSRERDEQGRFYDGETTWGKFSYAPDTLGSLLILKKGTPPPELLPQPRLNLATATVHAGYVSIHNNGASFDMDLVTRDTLDFGTLRLINRTLAGEELPVVVWQVDEVDSETPPIIRITNESAMLFASSAIWSPEDQQLVAAHTVSTSHDLLKAIKATLANSNSKSYLTVKTPEDSAYLKSARKGFIAVSGNLVQANAEGTVTALLHPLSGDPQAHSGEYFYIVATQGESLPQKFSERLDLAIPWPVQPEWADYLLEVGKQTGMVEVLPSCGDDFASGLRVVKNETQWADIISTGLKRGRISIS